MNKTPTKSNCSIYYSTPLKLTLIGDWSVKEIKLSNGRWLYYRYNNWNWSFKAL